MRITGIGLYHVLQAFPSVEHLTLKAVAILGSKLDFDPNLLPHLHNLGVLKFPDDDDTIDLETLMRFIETRSPLSPEDVDVSDATIRKVTISVSAPEWSTSFDNGWLNLLRDRGVDFSFQLL